jgi:hypothetical protein
MNYKLQVKPQLGYLHVVATGDNTRSAVVGYLADLPRICAERKCWYVLLEDQLQGPRLGLREVLQIAMQTRIKHVGRMPVIAFVDASASIFKMRIAEAVCTLRGISIWMFRSVAEAQHWLVGAG